jgi:hypothetical protein
MRKTIEILVLKHEAGYPIERMDELVKSLQSIVGGIFPRGKAAGISWPLPEINENELFPEFNKHLSSEG